MSNRLVFTAMASVLPIALAGCASNQTYGGTAEISLLQASELPAPDGAFGASPRYDPRIGKFDTLTIDVLGFEELSGRSVIVDGAGNITVPIGGQIAVGGLSTDAAARAIEAAMRAGFVRDPRVAVNFEEIASNYVTVQGSVELPGNYATLDKMTLTGAIAAARGFDDVARTRDVVLLREIDGQQYAALYDVREIERANYPDPLVYPRDRIIVGESSQRRLLQQVLQGAPLLVGPLVAILQSNN